MGVRVAFFSENVNGSDLSLPWTISLFSKENSMRRLSMRSVLPRRRKGFGDARQPSTGYCFVGPNEIPAMVHRFPFYPHQRRQ